MTTLSLSRQHISSLTSCLLRRRAQSSLTRNLPKTDSCGIPIRPTWSVNKLLETYSSPEITSKMITRLHELSALKPPQEGTVEYHNVKESLQEMVRLVEAVRSVDTSEVLVTGRGEKEDADRKATYLEGSGKDGHALLKNAPRVDGDYYVVDSMRKM